MAQSAAWSQMIVQIFLKCVVSMLTVWHYDSRSFCLQWNTHNSQWEWADRELNKHRVSLFCKRSLLRRHLSNDWMCGLSNYVFLSPLRQQLNSYLLNWQTSYLRLAIQFKQDQKNYFSSSIAVAKCFRNNVPWGPLEGLWISHFISNKEHPQWIHYIQQHDATALHGLVDYEL